MSGLPTVIRPTDCCAPSCSDATIQQVPGPQGPAGADGTNGTNGTNAFTTNSAQFTMPAVAATVVVTVTDSTWATIGQIVFVQSAGYFTVDAKTDSTHMTLNNLGYTGNAAPATIIAVSNQIGPAGKKGTDGAAGSVTLNDISPTTTKGDIIVDNGANSPNANDVRLAVGTDGQIPVADSTQPSGLAYKTITPNATTNNGIPRYNGPLGTPCDLKTSGLIITNTGAIQSLATGGDPRGASAIDLQVVRGANAQVASGATSVVSGGKNNTASGVSAVVAGGDTNAATAGGAVVCGGGSNTSSGGNSVIAGGTGNIASGTGSAVVSGANNSATGDASLISGGSGSTASGIGATIGGGNSHVASGDYSAVVGGDTNTANATNSSVHGGSNNLASGLNSAVVGGDNNKATGENSTVLGGEYAKTRLSGQASQANGRFAADGDAQVSNLVARIQTSDATPAEMFLDGGGATQRMVLSADTTWTFAIYIVARRTDADNESGAYKFEGCIDKQAAPGSTAIVGSVAKTVIAEDTAAWDVGVTADAANDSLLITVTGAIGSTINWVARITLIETTG